jgi:hypothetical protein
VIKFRQNCKNNFNLLITLKKFVAKGAPYDSKQSNIFLLNEKLEVLASNENAPKNLSTYAKKAVSGEQELFTLDKIQYVSTYVPISINNWKLVALLEILEDDMKN